MKPPEILILGGGFGGVYSYLNLLKELGTFEVNITIVSKSENFTFIPMLTEYLTGDIALADIQQPLSKLVDPKGCSLHIAEVTSIDYKQQRVTTTRGALGYDYLIIALGSITNFYGIAGAEQHSLVLRNTDDATKIAKLISKNIKLARKTKDRDRVKSMLTVAIVGAGPTGVELAAKISELDIVRHEPAFNIQLIDTNDHILQLLPQALRQKAARILVQKSITIRTSTATQKITEGILHFSDGTVLEAGAIIWTAGVKSVLPSSMNLTSKTGQIIVDKHLRVLGSPNVFAIGDIAAVQTYMQQLPTAAQVAVEESKTVAINIARTIRSRDPLEVFEYRSRGIFIPLGRWKGVGQLGDRSVSGPIVWLGWKLIYVWRFPMARRRFFIIFHWIRGLLRID